MDSEHFMFKNACEKLDCILWYRECMPYLRVVKVSTVNNRALHHRQVGIPQEKKTLLARESSEATLFGVTYGKLRRVERKEVLQRSRSHVTLEISLRCSLLGR